VYVRGLLGPGERKSVEPLVARVAPDDYEQVHHFVCTSCWDPAPLERVLAAKAQAMVGGPSAVLIIDDTALLKQDKRPVGVARQYAGAAGKTTNCQTLVSLTLARDEVPVGVAQRLFLPEQWTRDPERCMAVGVPEDRLAYRTKLEIALEELDRISAAGVTFGFVLADAGYGISATFRQALAARGLTWAVGIPRIQKVYPPEVTTHMPTPGVGMHRGRPRHPVPSVVSTPAKHVLAAARWRRLDVEHRHQGPALSALRRTTDRRRGWHAERRRATSAWRGRMARGRVARHGREKVLPDRPSATDDTAPPRRRDQGALGRRAGAPATEGGAEARPFRAAHLARTAPPRAPDADQLRVSPAPAAP
jgi:hypothetical protein